MQRMVLYPSHAIAVVLLCCALATGQVNSHTPLIPNRCGLGIGAKGLQAGGADILSDTQGFNFGPYVKDVADKIQQNWHRRIPTSSQTKKGRLAIEIAIARDGGVKDMRFAASSGDVSLDRAAWEGITTSNPFPPLPSEFKGECLALRFRFSYNPNKP